MTGIWEHEGNVENTSRKQEFSTFLECSQMSGVFYHSVIHRLGFFICFMIQILHTQNNKTRSIRFSKFYTLIKHGFWPVRRAQGPILIYILNLITTVINISSGTLACAIITSALLQYSLLKDPLTRGISLEKICHYLFYLFLSSLSLFSLRTSVHTKINSLE